MNKVVKDFIKENVVVYAENHCGAFNIVQKLKFPLSWTDKEQEVHQVSIKKGIRMINEWNSTKGEKYYFFVAGYVPNEVIEWLRSETSDFAVKCLIKDTYSL